MKAKLIEIALKEYGVHETPDPNTANPRVLEFFAASGNSWVKDDTNYAWCSAFMNWLAKQAGLPMTRSLLAQSWLIMGRKTNDPEIGDLVIFWRDSIESGHGHVSLFIKRVGDDIYCLGGNQSDEVNISIYPASRLLGYRDITVPAESDSDIIFSRTLKIGMKGDDVKKMQSIIGATPDGNFGPYTQKAVMEFQEIHGLKADGIVGKNTIKALEQYGTI